MDEVRPDVIVEDNVVLFPAVTTNGAPWVRLMSCNPLEVPDPGLPPAYSGLPVRDRGKWAGFREEYARTHADLHGEFDAWARAQGSPALPALEFMPESPWLNLWLYPAEADSRRTSALGATWHRLDSCVRATDPVYEIPRELAVADDGALLYLSLGSLGSADVGLMQRLIDLLGRTEHRVIVSMGPQHELLRLGPNMTGAEFLPQPSILPQVDLVITHGGNNTVTECFHHGRPMLVLPIFWDQHDNATRVQESGFGERLDTYHFADDELSGAIARLLHDDALRDRLAAASARLRANLGTERAAGLIERLAREPAGRP